MTALCVSAQDLKEIFFGIWKDGRFIMETVASVPPEEYLLALDGTLKEWNMSLGDIDAVMVVTGPGSFTSSRVSVVMANVIAFAREIRIFGVENPKRFCLSELAKTIDWTARFPASRYAVPVYDRPPHITTAK